MKTIGIIGAMEEEVASLKEKTEIIAAKKIVGIEFFMGKMSGKNVVIVRSGIGKVNAAVCTQALIDLYGVDYVVNTGVAGAISKELNVGDVVVSSDLVHHDFDTREAGDPVGVIPRMSESFFKADEELIRLAREAGEKVLTDHKLFLGRIATGDQFIAASEVKKKIWSNFQPLCAEMEGAAIAQACYLNKIPFVVIRAVSDKADEEAGVSFDQFVVAAAKNSSAIVEEMVKLL